MSKYGVTRFPTDEERLSEERERWAGEELDAEGMADGCVIVYPVETTTARNGAGRKKGAPSTATHHPPLSLGGFCPVALSSGRGLLLPGDRRIGLLRHRGRHYAFSSVGRARRFGADPERFVDAARRIIKENACLEHLLGGK